MPMEGEWIVCGPWSDSDLGARLLAICGSAPQVLFQTMPRYAQSTRRGAPPLRPLDIGRGPRIVFKPAIPGSRGVVLRTELHFAGRLIAGNAGDESEHQVGSGGNASG